MPTVAVLSAQITADTKDLESGLARANQQVSTFGSGLSSVLSGIGAGIGIKIFDTLESALKAAGEAIVGFNGRLEQSKIAFTSMLGSAEKATAFIEDLKAMTEDMPFSFENIQNAAKQMLAFGFEATKVKPLIESIAKAVAGFGGGDAEIDRVTKALGQMQAATTVQLGELNQLTEVGIPAFQILADKIGVPTGEIKKMVSEGKIASDVFIKAFQEWSNAKFGDILALQAKTWLGALNSIADSARFAVSEGFKPLFDLLSSFAVVFSQFLKTAEFKTWAASVAAEVMKVADAIRTVIQVFQNEWEPDETIDPIVNAIGKLALVVRDTIMPAFREFGAFVSSNVVPLLAGLGASFTALLAVGAVAGVIALVTGALTLLLSPIGLIGVAVAGLMMAWQNNWLNIQGATSLAWEKLQPIFTALVDWLGQKIPPVLEWITKTAWPAFVEAATKVGTYIVETLVPAFTDLVLWLGEKIPPVVEWISNTGWPGLVKAGTDVSTTVQTMSEKFAGLFKELEKSGAFEQTAKLWEDLFRIGGKLWPIIQLLHEKNTELGQGFIGLIRSSNDFTARLLGLNTAGEAAAKVVAGLWSAFSQLIGFLRAQLWVFEHIIDGLNTVIRLQGQVRAGGGVGQFMSGRAEGGPVRAGQPYVVGEKGPEVFVPNTAGSIMPNSGLTRGLGAPAAMAGGSTTYIVNVTFMGHALVDRRGVEDVVVRALDGLQRNGRMKVRVV